MSNLNARNTYNTDLQHDLSIMHLQTSLPTFYNLKGSIDHQYLHPSGIFFLCNGTGRCMEIDSGDVEQSTRAQRIFYHNLDEYLSFHKYPSPNPCPFHSSTNFPLYYPPTYNPFPTFPVYVQTLVTDFFRVLPPSLKVPTTTLPSTHTSPTYPSRQSFISDFFFPHISLSTTTITTKKPLRSGRSNKRVLKKIYITRIGRVRKKRTSLKFNARIPPSPSYNPLSTIIITPPQQSPAQTNSPLPFNCYLHSIIPTVIHKKTLSIHANVFIPLHQRRLSPCTIKAFTDTLSPDMSRSISKVNFLFSTPSLTHISSLKAPRLRHSLSTTSHTYTLTPQTTPHSHKPTRPTPTSTYAKPLATFARKHIKRVNAALVLHNAHMHRTHVEQTHANLLLVVTHRTKQTQHPVCFAHNPSYVNTPSTTALTFHLYISSLFSLFCPLLSHILYATIPHAALVVGIG